VTIVLRESHPLISQGQLAVNRQVALVLPIEPNSTVSTEANVENNTIRIPARVRAIDDPDTTNEQRVSVDFEVSIPRDWYWKEIEQINSMTSHDNAIQITGGDRRFMLSSDGILPLFSTVPVTIDRALETDIPSHVGTSTWVRN
jgi:hypothetical protein